MTLPTRARGRPTPERSAIYQAGLQDFCASIRKIASTLDFRVSSRGWCYLLEGDGVITKGEFDAAQDLINDCRKSGMLPLEICAADDKRATAGTPSDGSGESVEQRAQEIIDDAESAVSDALRYGHLNYQPIGFWSQQWFYVELVVEKIDLKSLFAPVASKYHVPITNMAGWSDINARADLMARFARWDREGKRCVLLYCGDHDPGGLLISDFLRQNLADLSGAVGWEPTNLQIDRFGLNFDLIEQLGLTWIDNLETSSGGDLASPRHPDHGKSYVQDYLQRFGARKCEANALVIRPWDGREDDDE